MSSNRVSSAAFATMLAWASFVGMQAASATSIDASGSSPYSATPTALPGTIQAENFDNGGAEVAYHDNSIGNAGGAYRATDVDLEATIDAGGGYDVGWVGAGEWLTYTVNVAAAGSYTIAIRVASPGAGGTFHVEMNGVDATGPLHVPATGGWQAWTTVEKSGVRLAAGVQVLRLVFDAAGSSGAVGNVNWIGVKAGASTPYSSTPIALPGTIQAENFDNGGAEVAYHDSSAGNAGGAYRATDVDLETTSDSGAGYDVGWVSAGEWLTYTVNVAAAGSYTIVVRVASPGAGGTFHLEANGVDATGPLHVPATGGWQAWTTVEKNGVRLAAGVQVLRLVFDAAGSSGAVGNVNWIGVKAGASTPYSSTPIALPGTIQAENFDNGGAEVAYHDSSAGNAGGAYRVTDVDLETTSDSGAGYDVGWVSAGEWLTYTVNVAAAGSYTIAIRVASPSAGGTFHLEANGVDATGPLHVPATGGWQAWTTVEKSGVRLAAGVQVLRLVFDAAGSSGAVGNVNWIGVKAGASTPYNSTPIALPGTIQAENFDNGGAEVAYHDSSAGNAGGAYRVTDVDLETTSDSGAGYDVGWVSAGEWLTYTVNVAAAGSYTIAIRVASPSAGGTFHVEANGVDATGPMQVPATGGWQSWTTVEKTGVRLAAGLQVLRIVFDAAGSSGAVGNVNWIRVASAASGDFALTAPSPGSKLRTTTVTFEWTGAGDDFTLSVGSAPGGADIYASGSLGQVAQHTVSHLPLDGRPLYVQVRRRLGTSTETASAQYTAPVRKALAVITDFSDRRLEDWTGAGIKSVGDLSAQLAKMADHWNWLSRGLEKTQWNIVRIQLAQAAVPGAFSGWVEFRDTVAGLVKQKVNLADYDVNGDGVLDISWSIVSSGDVSIEYAIGGASRNADVNMFVDGQASGSVIAGATGNFNHEVGHLVGIPDMYGPYGTLGSLTIMSYSWDLPPGDFAAYDRLAVGWLSPRVVSETTQGVWLPPAGEQLAAVKVPTSRASEYFLIEYRHKPDSGYGSADVPYNGLVVYHVLEGSSMGQDPPIVKVEPADGAIEPSHPTDPFDCLYPGNPRWTPPLVLYSYAAGVNGEPQEVFRIDNVSFRDAGMAFDVTMASPGASNLLANGSFETGNAGIPDGWVSGTWSSASSFLWQNRTARSGYSAMITAASPDDASWQTDTAMVPGESYQLCGWLKGEGIAGAGMGANVSVIGGWLSSQGRVGTFDWAQSCVTFTAPAASANVACRLGFYGSLATGTLWCDDMSLERLRRVF